MVRKFETELLDIKDVYIESTKNVKKAGLELTGLFKQKVVKIKEKCATFFAKMEHSLQICNKDVVAISALF